MIARMAAVFLVVLASVGAAQAEDGGRYGQVEVVAPSSPAQGLVILFSDASGLQLRDRARLSALADAGAIAVGVDTKTYLRKLGDAQPGCLNLVEDAETLSRQLQREHPTRQYRVPVVAGEGLGGALASGVVAQSPLQTVGAGVAIDPSASPPFSRELCPRPLEADDHEEAGTIDAPVLKNRMTVALTSAASPATRLLYARRAERTKLMTMRDLIHPDDPAAFVDLIRPFLGSEAPRTVAGLPLIELPALHHSRRMAIFLSGDGGWRDLDKRVAERLQELDVSVVGWDSLRYFWSLKTPEQAAADLGTVISAYKAKWNCDEIALIGYSFGADAMPFIYDRLDAADRSRIAQISIVSPGVAADWVIGVPGWLDGDGHSAATPLAPVVSTLPENRVQCFYGDRDVDRTCDLFAAQGAEVFKKSGDHHMDRNYDLIGQEIAEGFDRRLRAGL